MIDDPIVNEIRRIRRAYAQAFDNNLHAICEDLRRQERESNREFWVPSWNKADAYKETSRIGPTIQNKMVKTIPGTVSDK